MGGGTVGMDVSAIISVGNRGIVSSGNSSGKSVDGVVAVGKGCGSENCTCIFAGGDSLRVMSRNTACKGAS